MIFAIGVIAFCAGALFGVGFGVWYERGQQRREDEVFRARMRAYYPAYTTPPYVYDHETEGL